MLLTQSMTRQYNIEIPARFVFRPFAAKWVQGTVELLDWTSLDAVDMVFHSHDPQTRRGVAVPDLVEAILRFPSVIGAAADSPSKVTQQHSLKLLRTSLPPGLISHWENPSPKSDISGRRFEVLVYVDPKIRDMLWRPVPGNSVKNPWEMRDEFVNLPHDIRNLQKFLDRWGVWERGVGYEVGFSDTPVGCLIIYPHVLWDLQLEFRNALTSSSRRWLSKASLFLKKLSVPPYFTVEESFCASAIRATITLDHLGRARFGICKRHDCRRLFERISKQKRIYCGHACAHVANMREQRDRARKGIHSKATEDESYVKAKRT